MTLTTGVSGLFLHRASGAHCSLLLQLSTAAPHHPPNVVYEETLEEMDGAGASRGLPIERNDDARPPSVNPTDQHPPFLTKSQNGSIAHAEKSTSHNTATYDFDEPQKTLNVRGRRSSC